jgi:hypothetical protein
MKHNRRRDEEVRRAVQETDLAMKNCLKIRDKGKIHYLDLKEYMHNMRMLCVKIEENKFPWQQEKESKRLNDLCLKETKLLLKHLGVEDMGQ